MIPRPRFRLPIWVALVLAGIAYLTRAWLWKAGDLAPELPSDAVVAVAFAIGVTVVAWARHNASSETQDEGGADEPRPRD